MRLRPSLLIPLLACLLAGPPAGAQARYNIHFRSDKVSGNAGEVVTMGIGLDNQPEKVTGFSFGVKHEAAKLALESVVPGPDLQAALGAGAVPDPDFFALNQAPAGGAGFTVGMILSRNNANVVLAPGLDHHIFDVKYRLPAGATGDTRIDITGDLGSPKVPVILDLNGGTAQKPAGTPAGRVTATVSVLTGPPPFVRGDANQSGRLDVTDAVIILDYLFSGASLPAGAATRTSCLVVLNVDASVDKVTAAAEDPQDIDVTDATILLQYVFLRGIPPQPPFPKCGQPSTTVSAEMACKDFLCR